MRGCRKKGKKFWFGMNTFGMESTIACSKHMVSVGNLMDIGVVM